MYTDATLVFPGTFFAQGALVIRNFSTICTLTHEAAGAHQKLNLFLRKTKVV